MKKTILRAVAAALIAAMCTSCSPQSGELASPSQNSAGQATPAPTAEVTVDNADAPHQYGNTQGNIMNRGLVAENADYVFISQMGEIIKQEKATDKVSVVFADHAECLNVVGDLLFYINTSDENKLYKIRFDGSAREKVSDEKIGFAYIVDGWCYYDCEPFLYKMRIDGSGKVSIFDDENLQFFCVDGSYVYFSLSARSIEPPTNPDGIYRMKTDGTDVTLLVEKSEAYVFQIFGDTILFEGEDDTSKGFFVDTVKTDGTNYASVANAEWLETFNVYDDWVYYAEDDTYDSSIYKMRLDGSERTMLFDNSSGIFSWPRLFTANEWLYIGDTDGDYDSIKVRLDGSSPNPWIKRTAENEYFSLNSYREFGGFEIDEPSASDSPSYYVSAMVDDTWERDFHGNGVYDVYNNYFIDFDSDGKIDGCITIETAVPAYNEFMNANFTFNTNSPPQNVESGERYGWNYVQYDSIVYIDAAENYGDYWNEIYDRLGYEAHGKETYFYKGAGKIGVAIYSTYVDERWDGVLDKTYRAVVDSVMFGDSSGSWLTPGYSPTE